MATRLSDHRVTYIYQFWRGLPPSQWLSPVESNPLKRVVDNWGGGGLVRYRSALRLPPRS